jgi:7 transmembrane receptor (rhodopsin family)
MHVEKHQLHENLARYPTHLCSEFGAVASIQKSDNYIERRCNLHVMTDVLCACRFCVIFYPSQNIIGPRRAAVIVAFIWMMPLGLQVPWTVLQVWREFSNGQVHCWYDTKTRPQLAVGFFVGVIVLTFYVLPLIAITVFYSLVGTRVRQRNVQGIRGTKTERSIRQSKVCTGNNEGAT